MKKKTLLALAATILAALTLVPAAPRNASAGVGVCDPQQSRLCLGLLEWWQFDHTADAQFGSFANTPLYEQDGTNQALYLSGKGGAHGDALDFSGSNQQLSIPRFGSLAQYSTVAFWLRPDSVTGYRTLVSNIVGAPNSGGFIYRLNSGKPEMIVFVDETTSYTVYTSTTTLSAGTWYLLVFKVSPYGPYGNAQGCVSINGGAFSCGNLTYNTKPSPGDLTVGGRSGEYFDGGIDSFGIWSRAWDTDDVAWYWNSGSGRVFPF
jgi:hypothetical protein